jgi:hypothetical protein
VKFTHSSIWSGNRTLTRVLTVPLYYLQTKKFTTFNRSSSASALYIEGLSNHIYWGLEMIVSTFCSNIKIIILDLTVLNKLNAIVLHVRFTVIVKCSKDAESFNMLFKVLDLVSVFGCIYSCMK